MIELEASEDLKRTETILFQRENREYDNENKQKEDRNQCLHLKRINFEKEHQNKCKREEAERKEQEL